MAPDDLRTGPDPVVPTTDAPAPAPVEVLGGLPVRDVLGARGAGDGGCEACGSPQARSWSTPDGPARLCPPCATLNGIGCP